MRPFQFPGSSLRFARLDGPFDFAQGRLRRLSQHKTSQHRNKRYTLKEEPQPQVLFTFGFSNLKPAPSRVST